MGGQCVRKLNLIFISILFFSFLGFLNNWNILPKESSNIENLKPLEDIQRFIFVISSGRAGSGYLAELLNTSKNIIVNSLFLFKFLFYKSPFMNLNLQWSVNIFGMLETNQWKTLINQD